MEQAVDTNLIRKQVMLSSGNISKLEDIAKQDKSSVASVIRSAIDAFNPDAANDNGDDSVLMALVSTKLKEAIEDTAKTRARLNKTLTKLEGKK